MKEMKRILSLVLCFVMLVGLALPAEALVPKSAGTTSSGQAMRVSGSVIDAAIFASDVHGNANVVSSAFNGIKTADAAFDPSTATFVGDTQMAASDVTSAAQSVYSDVACYYAYGNHDSEGNYGIADVTGLIYGDSATNYYIYAISQTSMASSNPDTSDFTSTVAGLDQSKPLFIASHLPLHDRRGDSKGAAAWYEAISAAAESMDIVFFWAHNHTGEDSVDEAAFYVAKDGDETITLENTNTVVTPNFTYMNAGYVGKSSSRGGVVTTVKIYADAMVFQDYTSTGAFTGEYSHNVEVAREFAVEEAQINAIAVTTKPSKLAYITGEELDTTGMVVTAAYSDGTTAEVTGWYVDAVDMTTAGEKTVTVNYAVDGLTFQTSYTITVEQGLAEGVVLTGIEVTTAPAKVEYLLSESLDLDGLVVVATFSDGSTKELAYKPFSDSLVYGGYELENFSMYVEKDQAVEVSYTLGEVTCTDTFTISVWEENFADAVTNVIVALIGDYGVTGTSVSELEQSTVADAIAEVIQGDTFVAYDISLVFDPEYSITDAVKTVTLPIPEGVENPVVYYVDDEGNVTDMGATKGDGVVTFETTHFSTYVVGEATEITVDDPETATGTGDVTTTTKKTVYVLTNSISSGNSYLIVNGNAAGSYNALANNSGSVAATGVTVKTDDEIGTYIELDDATDELWLVASGYTFQNGSYYLGYTTSGSSWNTTYTFGLSTTSRDWDYSSNRLSTSVGSWSSTTYYLRYNSGWTWTTSSNSASSVYFYVPTEVEVESTATVSGTYSIDGEDMTIGVDSNENAALISTLTFTPESGTATTTDVSAEATYTVVEGGDPNGVIAKIENGEVTFTGNYGKALVKVSYETAFGEVTDYITITAVEVVCTLNIDQGDSVIHKGVQNGQTLALTATLNRDGVEVENPSLTWEITAGGNIATIDASTGTLTFSGEEGDVKVRVSYKVNETTTVEDYITVHVHKSTAITPEESTTDFPRWPNEGAVRYDKTATAVGNFSNTGVAQVELSMAGIPQKTGSAIDVVLVLDASGSMTSTRIAASIAAAKVFAEKICYTNGEPNQNRIAIVFFGNSTHYPVSYSDLGNNTTYGYELATASGDWEDSTLYSCITGYCGKTSSGALSGGTKYQEALSVADRILTNAKTDGTGNNRSQYLLFMTDGAPTEYNYVTNYDAVQAGTADTYTMGEATGQDKDNASSTTAARYEYYTACMKQRGVTVYTVGTALTASANANSVEFLRKMATDDAKAYAVSESDVSSGKLSEAFQTIAEEINQAATNIEVTDKITEDYEMIFQWPDAVTDANKVAGQEFYIDVVNYELDETTHERNGSYDVLLRVYLTENADGTLAISKLEKIEGVTTTSAGTTTTLTTTPAYTAVGEDENGYFNLVDGVYVYVADGTGAYNMTEGATVSGTSDTVVLHTPYFSYTASDKVIKWHVSETAENSEIALRYFLYLTGSLESVADGLEEGDEGYVAPGTYPTNDYATMEYTNYKGNDCLQYFPEPQLTWNGAQVSYVFYLVNEDGVPVNTAGREVTFAEAVFVTKIYTESVVWNEAEGKTSLDALKKADELLPTDYKLYDSTTQYEIHVYQNANGEDIYNYFVITNGDGTTIVYNTKAGTKYSTAGTYTSKDESMEGFDFANTTVAFAVVWERKLVEDTVVVDFGLPVDINVTTNDFVYNSINAIGTETPSADINDGLYFDSALSTKIDASTSMSGILTLSGGHTAQIMNENVIRFTPGTMEFKAPVTFHYETTTEYYENSAVKSAYLYSSVTVIPATTVYYEDSFVTFSSYTADADGNFSTTPDATCQWTVDGTAQDKTQAQDRPGASMIADALDADNNYGYDAAYSALSTHSLGSSRKITVNENVRGEATFTFWGTGFDVLALSSSDTGSITVQVYQGASASGDAVKTSFVDTYYGMDADGNVSLNTPDALYQVPVMKISGLTYGQYTVKIIAGYNKFFDHVAEEGGKASYTLYLDAIRIYDPTGNQNETANDAYLADGEAYPVYQELRNNIIAASNYSVDAEGNVSGSAINGAIFIDTVNETSVIADYVSYGPSNELYLANGQSIAFNVTVDSTVADVQLGIKVANGSAVTYSINGDSYTVNTTTDLYYSILDYAKAGTVTITNTSGGILSLTNIKVTHTSAPTSTADLLWMDAESATYALMSLRSAPVVDKTEPEVTEPETTEPETTEPEVTEPETTEPEETKPETTEPETTEPEETEPEETKPEPSDEVEELIEVVKKIIRKFFGRLFG